MNANTQDTGKQETGRQGMSGGFGGSTQTGSAAKMHEDKGDGKFFGGTEMKDRREGTVAKTIEQQTSKLPSDLFLWAAVGGMGVSALLELTGYKDKSRFFGQWVAPFLLFGVYNKLVKQHGSDQAESA